jgi:hypothetical protein
MIGKPTSNEVKAVLASSLLAVATGVAIALAVNAVVKYRRSDAKPR